MSYRLCVWQLMEQPVEQPCNCVERKERTRCLKILIMKIYYISFSNIAKNIKMLIKVYITALKRFRIFSILFDAQRVGTPIINE